MSVSTLLSTTSTFLQFVVFLLKWPLWVLQYMFGSLKDKVHEFFYIKRVVGKLRVFPQSWMVPLQTQTRAKIPKSPRVYLFYRHKIVFLCLKQLFQRMLYNMGWQAFSTEVPLTVSALPTICSQSQILRQGNAEGSPDNMQANVPVPNKTLFRTTTGGPDLHHKSYCLLMAAI